MPPPADPEPLKPENTLRIKKIVLSLSALIFPLVTISLSYAAVFPSSRIYFTVAPLVAFAIFLLISIASALYLGAVPERYAKLAVLPILSAAVSSGMILLFNPSFNALFEGGFVKVNMLAVLLSAGVFGGVALGSSVAFLLFASRFRW